METTAIIHNNHHNNNNRNNNRNRRRVTALVGALTFTGMFGSTLVNVTPAGASSTVQTESAPWSGLGFRPGVGATVEEIDGRILISGAIELDVASTPIVFAAGSVVLQRNDETGRWDVVTGFAQLPIPDIGLLAGVDVRQRPFAQFGRATGAELAHLDAHLRSEATYWYFQFDASLQIASPFGDVPGLSALGDTITIAGVSPGLFVMEERGTYVYVGGECPELPSKRLSKRAARPRTPAQRQADATRTSQRARLSAARDLAELLRQELSDQRLPLAAAPTDVDVTPCGFGFAVDNSIPGIDLHGNPMNGSVVLDGVFNVHPFIEVNGTVLVQHDRAGVALAAHGDINATVPMTDLSLGMGSADVSIRIDGSGARLTGAAALALPGVPVQGTALVDLRIDAVRPVNSFFHADAAVTIGSVPLAKAAIDVSQKGLFVNGKARVGGVEVAVSGQVSPQGASLTGRTTVTLPTHELARLAANAVRDIDLAQQEVDRLNGEIVQMRLTIRNERRASSRTLATANASLAKAQADLHRIDATIARNNASIQKLRHQISNEIARYRRLNPWEKAVQSLLHGGRLASWNAAIAGLDTANATQRTYQDAANVVLVAARNAIAAIERDLASADVDGDLRIVQIKVRRDAATAGLQALRTAAGSLSSISTLKGTLSVTIGTKGVAGSISVQLCNGSRCQTLAGARLRLGANPQACVDVLGLGEVCSKL